MEIFQMSKATKKRLHLNPGLKEKIPVCSNCGERLGFHCGKCSINMKYSPPEKR